MKLLIPLLFILIFPLSVKASITEQGRGMMVGEDHAFFFTASTGWVLDNHSGINQGIHMIFYPAGMTWNNSPAIIYGRSISKSEVSSIPALVETTVSDFHGNGSPNYAVKENSSIKLSNGSIGQLYNYSGDQWGNFESVVYFNEKETINFLVYNARNKELFDKYQGDFSAIAKTYNNIYNPPHPLLEGEVKELIERSKNELQAHGREEYESKAIRAIGDQIATFMKDCTSYLPNEEQPSFHLIQQINRVGLIDKSVVYPSTTLSVCFKGLMSTIKYPEHNFESFLLDINMSTTD